MVVFKRNGTWHTRFHAPVWVIRASAVTTPPGFFELDLAVAPIAFTFVLSDGAFVAMFVGSTTDRSSFHPPR